MYLQINFPWSEIRRISYSGDKFIVKLTTKATPKFIAQVLHRMTVLHPWLFKYIVGGQRLAWRSKPNRKCL